MSEAGGSRQSPTWACPGCGEQIRALTESRLETKREEHKSECETEVANDPADDAGVTYTVDVEPPRTLGSYRASDHFQHMLRRRENPDASWRVVEDALADGRIKHTHKSGRFIFEYDRGLWTWWVLVQMVDEAFVDTDKNHILVTVYAPDSDAHEEVTKLV